MKTTKKIIACLLILMMTASILAGCSQRFDCSGYIKGMLDAMYKGDFARHVTDTQTSKDEVEEIYLEGIDIESQVLLDFLGLTKEDLPDDVYNEVMELMKDIYSYSKYEVKEADKDGYVDIVITPIDIYNDVYEEIMNFGTEFAERNNNYEFSDYTDEEYIHAFMDPVIEIFRKHLDPIAYSDPVTITVHVVPDSNNVYGITDEKQQEIDMTLINYTLD